MYLILTLWTFVYHVFVFVLAIWCDTESCSDGRECGEIEGSVHGVLQRCCFYQETWLWKSGKVWLIIYVGLWVWLACFLPDWSDRWGREIHGSMSDMLLFTRQANTPKKRHSYSWEQWLHHRTPSWSRQSSIWLAVTNSILLFLVSLPLFPFILRSVLFFKYAQ